MHASKLPPWRRSLFLQVVCARFRGSRKLSHATLSPSEVQYSLARSYVRTYSISNLHRVVLNDIPNLCIKLSFFLYYRCLILLSYLLLFISTYPDLPTASLFAPQRLRYLPTSGMPSSRPNVFTPQVDLVIFLFLAPSRPLPATSILPEFQTSSSPAALGRASA